MKKHLEKQKGATLISWMIGIAVGILILSAGLKIGPHYIEYNSVKSFMNAIASEPGAKTMKKREIMARVEKYLNVNSMDSLSKSYYDSKGGSRNVEKPFKIVQIKKGNKRQLTVDYKSETPWLANIAFLLDFKYQVELGSSEQQ